MQTISQSLSSTVENAALTGLGEIHWEDAILGIRGSHIVRTSKCTIGSQNGSTIQLPSELASPTHVSLTFGKRFTLLKAFSPTRVDGRQIREWLIDTPTEFAIGSCRFLILPANSVTCTRMVVRSHQLAEAASRLRGSMEPPPTESITPSQTTDPTHSEPRIDRELELTGRLDAMESALKEVQQSIESLAEITSQEQAPNQLSVSLLDEFQKLSFQLTSSLDLQLENRLEERDLKVAQLIQENNTSIRLSIAELADRLPANPSLQSDDRLDEAVATHIEERLDAALQIPFQSINERIDRLSWLANQHIEQTSDISNSSQNAIANLETQIEELRQQNHSFRNLVDSARYELQPPDAGLQSLTTQINDRLDAALQIPLHSIHEQIDRLSSLANQQIEQTSDIRTSSQNAIANLEAQLEELRQQCTSFCTLVDSVRYELQQTAADTQTNFDYLLHVVEQQRQLIEQQYEQRPDHSVTAASSEQLASQDQTNLFTINSRVEDVAGDWQVEETDRFEAREPMIDAPTPLRATDQSPAVLESLTQNLHDSTSVDAHPVSNAQDLADGVSRYSSPVAASIGQSTSELNSLGAIESEVSQFAKDFQGRIPTDSSSSSNDETPSWISPENEPLQPTLRHASSVVDSDIRHSVRRVVQPRDPESAIQDRVQSRSEMVFQPSPLQEAPLNSVLENGLSPDLYESIPSDQDREQVDEPYRHSPQIHDENESTEEDIDSLSERLRRLLAEANETSETRVDRRQNKGIVENSSIVNSTSPYEVDNPRIERRAEDSLGTSSNESEFGKESSMGYSEGIDSLYLNDAAEDRSSAEHSDTDPISSDDDDLSSMNANLRSTVSEPEESSSAWQNADEPTNSEGEEESIEAYMQKLLQRVKSGPDGQAIQPESEAPRKTVQRSRKDILTGSKTASEASPEPSESSSSNNKSKMTQAEFKPRQQAPERKNELDALRELANINARRAIVKSETKKTSTAILFKLPLTLVALISAGLLFYINGLTPAPPLAGMFAALVVAALWGYDCYVDMRKLNSVKDSSESAEPEETVEHENDKNSHSGWRPTPA